MLCPSLQPKQQLSKTPPTLYIWLGIGRQGSSPKNWKKKINSVSNKGGGDLVCHLAPFDQCYCYNKKHNLKPFSGLRGPFEAFNPAVRPHNLSFSMIFSSLSISIRPFPCKKIFFLLQFFSSFYFSDSILQKNFILQTFFLLFPKVPSLSLDAILEPVKCYCSAIVVLL